MSPDGHWRGDEAAADQFVYVAEKNDGEQITLSTAEFEQQYGWKNDPEKVKVFQ